MSGAITRRVFASSGSATRQLAQALTPGPEPWMKSTGAPSPRSCTLVWKAPVRTVPAISGVLTPASSKLHADVAKLGVELQRMHAALAPDARGLGAPEGGTQVAQEPAVDPADAHLDAPRHAVRAAQVLRPHGGGQA